MTERCQTKFKEYFENRNNIIFSSLVGVSLAVIYFYRFHFATVAFSYGLGCLACYYGINSSLIHDYVLKLQCHFSKNLRKKEEEDAPVTDCDTCGSKDCKRHDPTVCLEPWVGLKIHKQLDQAIEEFYNTLLEQFINAWYSRITLEPFFVDELRYQLRYASASLLRRAVKVDYPRLIMDRLIPCALRHYTECSGSRGGAPPARPHPAACSRNAELRYLRTLTTVLMPYLLPAAECSNSIFRVLIREIFAGWVLLSLTDVLADPHILNTLVVLATNDEKMAQLPTTPNYQVEFLETFGRQSESAYLRRPRLLRAELEAALAAPPAFYALMHYARRAARLGLLHFYTDIKTLQTKILNPELSDEEVRSLHKEACAMHSRYFARGVPHEALRPLAEELCALVDQPPETVKSLQTSRALFAAARHSHADLEKAVLPKFLHSEEFYMMFIGSRAPTGYHKQAARKPVERLIQSALSLGARRGRRRRLAGETSEALGLDDSDPDGDGADNPDLLKCLENADDAEDLSGFKVVLTNVETRLQPPPRRGPVRVFTVAVHGAAGVGPGAGAGPVAARLWSLERSEHDFHLLRSKLHEFHGDRLLHDLPLPSRKDNSPLETLRYKYEDFLQRLLRKSLLQTSELLHLFLTVDGDFSMVVQASTLSATSSDIANIYQSVTHKLRKEKGQHLESFLRNLLVSSDKDRYQASKQGVHIEEGIEVIEDIPQIPRTIRARDLMTSVFGDNFGTEPKVDLMPRKQQRVLAGFTQCCLYLLIKVFRVSLATASAFGAALAAARGAADAAFNAYLGHTLGNLLCERRLAHLIRLGHGILFGKKSLPHVGHSRQRAAAFAGLRARAPAAACSVLEVLQKPHHNKQLVYNLLDLCVLELFPELSATDSKQSKKPKS